MANLNLSQFGENTSVSDADYTFVWDSAASISKKVSRNSWLNSGTLTSSAPVTISQTWNGTGSTVFKALVVNATTPGTTSSSSSLLLDLQVGGVSQFRVTKGGAAYMTNLAPSGFLSFQNDSGQIYFGAGGDVQIIRDAANTLALRNGAAAQTFNVYGTYTSITDYKRLSLSCSATTGNATIGVPFNSVLAVTGGSATATVATVTFAAQAAAFPVGSSVTVAGVTPAGYNATAVVTASTTTSVSYASTVNAAYVSGGTATVSGSAALTLTGAGNLGIGTTAPTSRLHVQATGQTGVRENLLKCTVSDSGNDAFYMANATVADGSFVPGFIGAVFSSSARYCLNLAGQTIAANDTGTAPMVAFSTAITTDAADPNNGTLSAVGTRPLFTWVNYTTTHMQMAANGNLGIGTTSPSSKLHVAGTIKPEQATMVDIALTTINLAASDAGTIINCTAATAVTVNLPTLDTNAGYNVMIIQSGAGAVTIADNGNTRNSFGSAFTTAGQHAACSIVRTAASTYNLSGNLV